ncbi:hypothetical protein Tco_0235791 [Tanacetum coccineum]
MNGKKAMTLDFNTFTTSTGLDYNNGAYVAHPSPEQLITYSLITRTKVDIGEIIYSDLATKLLNKSRMRYVSYSRFISYALEVILGLEYTQDGKFGYLPSILSNSNFSKDPSKVTKIELTAHMIVVNNPKDLVSPLPLSVKKKKGKSRTVTLTLPKSQGPEAFGALSKKRKQPKPKNTPGETKVSSPKPTEDSEQSHSVSSGTVPDPQDLERNIQLASTRLPSILDEGTCKTQPLPEGTAKTTSRPEWPLRDKDSGGNKSPVDMELINLTVADLSGTGEPDIKVLQLKTFVDVQALLLSDDETVQESDEEEVFEAGEDMDEDTQLLINDNGLSFSSRNRRFKLGCAYYCGDWLDFKCWNLMLSVELKAIQDVVKEDYVLNKKVLEATKAYTKKSTHLTKLLTLIKKFYFQGLKSLVEYLQATALTQEEHLASWAKSSTSMAWNLGPRMTAVESSQAEIRSEISSLRKDTSYIKSMMIEIYQSFKGEENATQAGTEEPPSYTEGEHAAMEEEPTNAVLITKFKPTEIPTPEVQPITTIISTSQLEPSVPQREGKAIVTDDQPEVQRKLMPASKEVRPDPDALILVPYEINRNFFQFTDEQIQAYLDKEEKIKKATEEAKMLEMIKTEVIKVVQEEAEKIKLDPKKIISEKAGEKFKKAQDAKHQVLKIEHSQKAKRAMDLRMKRVEQYMDFEVHNPFKLGDFRITKLDELGPIIEKKKSFIVKDLMTSLGKRYERLKKIPEELRIQSALPTPVPWQVASQSSRRKRKHMELEPKIKVPGLECNRSLPDGVQFVNTMVIEEPEYGIFFTNVFGDQAFQIWNDIHKVGVDSLVSYLVMALMVKTQENARFGQKLRKLIAEHPDQEKLQSKKVKLEALGYKLD